MTGLEVTEVAAEMNHIVEGRAIKDNANVLLRFSNGARGTLWASMGTPPSPSLEDGLKAQLIADKATESLKTGQPMKMTT